MKINIEINEEQISEIVELEIARRVLEENRYEGREAKYGVRNGIDKAVKEYIYKNKEEIIERVVQRASNEIVRKGLPKLLENLSKEV